MASAVNPAKAITSSQGHSRKQGCREQKHRQNDQFGSQRFLYNVMQMQMLLRAHLKFKIMYKHHVNLLVWKSVFVHLTMGLNNYTIGIYARMLV